ncbi:MAG: ATP-binding protein [Pedococcus sp.]
MSPADGVRERAGLGLATRLLIAQGLVLVAGAATTWLVASFVGPGIFHEHLRRAGVGHTSTEAGHVEEAFTSALLIAVAVALAVALLMTLAVSAYFTRRVHRSTTAVTLAASRIAEGHFESRIPSPAMGLEFELLADTVNALAQRLSDVEQTRRRILADLAHEMRTPLAAIEAHLEAVEDGLRELDAETLAVLHGATQRLHRLAEDIGTVSRAQEGQIDLRRTSISPATLITSAAAAAEESYAGSGVALVVADRRAPDVLVDPERLGQVMGNLLENALRHTPSGGRVELAASPSKPGWVELTVRDTGAGIADVHLARIFERFYRADPARTRERGGSGIGLTISRALVEAHGGRLTAHSAGVGHGSTFVIELPAARPRGGTGRRAGGPG